MARIEYANCGCHQVVQYSSNGRKFVSRLFHSIVIKLGKVLNDKVICLTDHFREKTEIFHSFGTVTDDLL